MSSADQPPLLELRNLTKIYGTGETATRVLKGLNLTLPRGGTVALRGASGSGKSTLLNIVGTLLRPTSGEFEMPR